MTGAVYPSLRGQVVFVSGGARGIGAELVTQFARQGAQAAFVDIDDKRAEALVAGLMAEGHPAPFYQHCDVRDIAALRAAIAAVIERFGPLNTPVNSAASDDPHTIAEVEFDYWEAGGGSIINIGSTVGCSVPLTRSPTPPPKQRSPAGPARWRVNSGPRTSLSTASSPAGL